MAGYIKNKPAISSVALSGSYTDLTNQPAIPTAVNADWNSNSGLSQILNKPTLGSAAFTSSSAYATAAQGALASSALQSQVQADWNAVSGVSSILNKPSIPSATPLSSVSPANLGSTAAVGTSTSAARADHVHQGPFITTGTNTTGATISIGGSVDVVVTLSGTMPNSTYKACYFLNGVTLSLIGTLTATLKSQTTTSVTVTIKNSGLAIAAAGITVDVVAISPTV